MGWKTHQQVTNAQEEYDFGFPPPSAECANGETTLYYGSAAYIGLGFSVLCFLVVIELFGSVFMKNCNVILALLFGFFVAGVSDYNGLNYVDTSKITDAPAITFLWVETFPIGFYGPAVIPMLIAYLVTTVETVGDLTGTYNIRRTNFGPHFIKTSNLVQLTECLDFVFHRALYSGFRGIRFKYRG